MTTPRDIINSAARDAGILGTGQTLMAEDSNEAFVRLNRMLAQWRQKRWLVYRLQDLSVTSTGATTYSVGPSGDIDTGSGTSRPANLSGGYFRQVNISAPNQVDYPLEQLDSREDYSRIRLKQLTSFPSFFFYDPSVPLGTLYVWPIPTTAIYEIHVLTKQPMTKFASLSETITLPEEYELALQLNLAMLLRRAYGFSVPPDLMKQAVGSTEVLRSANTRIPEVMMPDELPGVGNSGFNIYSGEY